jgi:hypothetical protein
VKKSQAVDLESGRRFAVTGFGGNLLPPPHPLAQPVAAPNPHRSHRRASDCASLKPEFFTDDQTRDLNSPRRQQDGWSSGQIATYMVRGEEFAIVSN